MRSTFHEQLGKSRFIFVVLKVFYILFVSTSYSTEKLIAFKLYGRCKKGFEKL